MYKNRNLGLDIIRSCAICFVLICHSIFFTLNINSQFTTYLGILSVEMFFVLSGFLVGKNMILMMLDDVSPNVVKKFYVNRFFRTIPLYYIMLLITSFIEKTPVPVSSFAFLQNFNENDLGFMPVSWSLSVEIWFYFFVPAFFVIFVKICLGQVQRRKAIFITIGLLYCIPLILRICHVYWNDPTWDWGVRKQVPLRLDSIMTGVYLAAAKIFYPNTYSQMARKKKNLRVSLIGLVSLGIVYCTYLGTGGNFDKSPFWKVFLFTLLPLFSGILMIYMENSPKIQEYSQKRLGKIVSNISEISYGVYLMHWNIFVAFSRIEKGWISFALAVLCSLTIGKVVYLCFEQPMMKVKEKIVLKL